MPRRGGGGHRRGSPHRRGGGRPKRKGDASSNGSGSPSNSEKQEPLWMEGVHSEEDLQQRHINHIYHLAEEPCREAGHGADNCEDNPSCLLKLGERADGVWAKCPPTIEELGDDPHTQARQPDVPAGLENLGATCYMNNVLQCLFMNTAFRQGVFAWGATGDDRMLLESHQHDESKVSSVTDNENPLLAAAGEQHQQQGQQDKEEHGRDSVCLELQRLFALMQEGHRSFYTTKSLSQALNLKTSIQQDAQEFYKLFLDYLEERFNHSADEAVKSLVLQFQGEYAYTTVCQACKTVSQRKCKFSELELNLKDAKTIDDSLQHFLAEEQLTEGNQYFCEQCNKLQDATRSIVLLDLPKVLNLQLMRFVYDLKTFHKKKLQDSIAFPLEIDMGQHMQDFDERSSSSLPSSSQPPCRQTEVENKRRRKGLTYELVGVLIHVGASANVGHYIAHIKDDVTKKWWRFDDAVVTPLEESKVGVEKETKKGGKKKSTLPEGMAESSNAYMLIYALKDRETIAQPRLPASATDVVLADNQEFEQQLKDYDVQVKEEHSRIAAHKEAYAAHFPSFVVKPDAKEYYWIATSWLRSWVTGAKELPPINNTELLCAHDMLDPRKLAQAKRITPEAWTMLHAQYKGGPVLSQECYCMPCSAALCHELATEAEYNRMKEVTLNLISAGAASKGYILSTAWLNQWRKKNEPEDLSRNMNEKITCEHGNLSPAGGRRVIPPQAWSWLRSQFPEGAEFHSSESACKECIKDSANNKVELSNLKALKVKERQRANAIASEKTIQTGCKYYLISQEWFARWRSWIENAPDPEEPNPIANESLICRHERLHVPVGDDQFPLDVDETEFRLVKPELWTKLLKRKEVDYPIVLQTEAADATGRAYLLDPPVCPECTEERQHNKLDQQYNYSEAEIVVTTKRRAAAVGRARRSKGVKTDSITVSADDTILVVKLKILEKLEIEPNEQALFFGDVELKDSKATLRQFRVPAKATIHIERRQMSMADYDILDGHNQIEEGFKGTIFSHDRAETNHLPVSTPPPGSEEQSSAATEQQKLTTADTRVCAVCTFHNSGQHVVLCEMCEAPLT